MSQLENLFHFEYDLLPCPFCKGTATMLPSRVSCDSCLCDMVKAHDQSYEDLVKCWNRRENLRTEEQLSDSEENRNFVIWLKSRESANPPPITDLEDAWLARARLQARNTSKKLNFSDRPKIS